MMKKIVFGALAVATFAFGSLASAPALAQSTWQLGGGTCNVNTALNPDAASCAVGGITATIQAWGNTGAGTNFVQYNLGENDPSGFGSIQVGGNETGTNGHHAFDNVTANCGTGSTSTGCGGTQEFMLISFTSAVNLNSLDIGYWRTDADMSIYRWDGAGAGSTAGTSLNASWKLVASEDVDQGCVNGTNAGQCATRSFGVTDATAVNGGNGTNLYSSWWLISTYVGTSTANSLDATNNDAFKLQSFTVNVCAGAVTGGNGGNGGSCNAVPEPGSLALAGLAIFGVAASGRRRFWKSRR